MLAFTAGLRFDAKGTILLVGEPGGLESGYDTTLPHVHPPTGPRRDWRLP